VEFLSLLLRARRRAPRTPLPFQFQKWNSSACSCDFSDENRFAYPKFQFQKWNSSACSPIRKPFHHWSNSLQVSIPEVEFLSLLHVPPAVVHGTPVYRFNSRSGIPQLAPNLAGWGKRNISINCFNSRSGIPQLAPNNIPSGEAILFLGFNSRSGIPQLAPMGNSRAGGKRI